MGAPFEPSYIKLARQGPVAHVTLSRSEKLNAFDGKMTRDLLRIFQELGADDTVRVAVLRAEGRMFSAGGDLSLEHGYTPESFRDELELYAEIAHAMLTCSKPIICEMNGDAIGWGATLALFCDIVVAASSAHIGDPHVDIGLSTGDGAAVIWPQLVGYAKARRFLLTGELVSAEVAQQWGLVSETVDLADLRTRVDQLASRIAAKPGRAAEMTKASVNLPLVALIRTHMHEYIDQELVTQATPAHRDAVTAFLNRRKKRD